MNHLVSFQISILSYSSSYFALKHPLSYVSEVPITKSKYADLINKLQAEDPGLSKTVPDKSPENYEDRQTWISLARHRHSDEVRLTFGIYKRSTFLGQQT